MVKSGQRWAVVGGGMMGLTLSHRLLQHNQYVTLIEARPSLGGLADAWKLGDVVWDRHYHVTLLSDSNLRDLLDEIGLGDDMTWVETRTGFYSGGQFYSMSNTAEFLRFPPLHLIDKLRLGSTIFFASKIRNWRRMERMSVESWLRRWSGGSVFQKMWLPLLRAKLGDAYQRTSAAFIWSYISRMYKARRTGLKKEMFGYVRGGYATILDRFSQVLRRDGATIQLSAQIERIEAGPDGRPMIIYADGSRQAYDHVILTTPSPVIARLCPGLAPAERQLHEGIEYLGIVCASLLLDRPLAGYYVTNITDDVPFTAVIEMSTIVDQRQLGGHTLAYLPKYVTQDDPILQQSDEEVRLRFVTALKSMFPDLTEEHIRAFRVSRVRHVMAIPTVEYSRRLPPMKTSIPGVFAINSAHILKGNLNVNETIGLADQAFQQEVLPLVTIESASQNDTSDVKQ